MTLNKFLQITGKTRGWLAEKLKCSLRSVYFYVNDGRIPEPPTVVDIYRLTKKMGHPVTPNDIYSTLIPDLKNTEAK